MEGKQKLLRILFGLAFLAAVGYLIYSLGFQGKAGSVVSKKGPKKEWFKPVEKGDLSILVQATGTVEPIDLVKVKAEASGKIVEMNVEEGQFIEAGTVIARLDQTDQRIARDRAKVAVELARKELERIRQGQNPANLRALENAVETARLNLKNARDSYERIRELHEQGYASDQELDNAKHQLSLTEEQLKKAEEDLRQAQSFDLRQAERLAELRLKDALLALDQAERQLGKSTVIAPISGTILKKFVSEGDTVQSSLSSFTEGTTIVTMADLTAIQVRADVDEVDIGRVKPGQRVEVSSDAYPGEVFPGKVKRVLPQGKNIQGLVSFEVIIELENPELKLMPGMTVDCDIYAEELKDVLLVPFEAVRADEDDNPIVYVWSDEGKEPEKRRVELGATDYEKIQIISGVKEGELVQVEHLPETLTLSFTAGG